MNTLNNSFDLVFDTYGKTRVTELEPIKHEVNREKSMFVSGVCCATEDGIVRKHLDALVGQEGYTFNSLTYELCLRDASRSKEVAQQLDRAGFPARSKEELQQPQSFWGLHRDGVTTGVAAILAATGMIAEQFGVTEVIIHALLLSAIITGGWRVFVRAWKSVRTYAFDMNVLMSVAVIGALMIGKWSEGATVIIFFAISLMLESYGNARTRRAIQSLMALSPEQACVVLNGLETIVPAKDVVPGQVAFVRPGERVPIDGVIVEGRSLIDESLITGEATPVARTIDDNVFAGSINGRGFLRVRSTARYEDTTLARIVHLVEAAQLKRAPVQNLVEKFARIYTPVVLVVAVTIAILPPLITQASFGEWFYRALVLLVIACPCALVISTPIALVSALTFAARHGILIKGGRQIETLSNVQAIAFDKTGTLTRGRPTVTDIVPLNSLPEERILQIAAALEHRSEHPLASAILDEAVRHCVKFDQLAVRKFEALPALGVKGEIDGERYFLGSDKLCEEQGIPSLNAVKVIQRLELEGKTIVVLAKDMEMLCIFAVQDSVRDQSKPTVNALKGLGIRQMILLSGDHETSAQRIADELGIGEYRGALHPQQKIDLVERLKVQYGTVAMVGDGVNDAPALATASVGIAMGTSGADAVLETADVVLMGDDLSKLPLLIRLSRDAMFIVRQNIVIALSLKLVFLLLSVAGLATLWMAVLADDGAALVVIFNSLRVLSISEEI